MEGKTCSAMGDLVDLFRTGSKVALRRLEVPRNDAVST